MNDQTLFSIFFSAMVVNNFTLALFLGAGVPYALDRIDLVEAVIGARAEARVAEHEELGFGTEERGVGHAGGLEVGLGTLRNGHVVETDRSGLVAQYAGQTGPKTNKLCDSAVGGVLFIDAITVAVTAKVTRIRLTFTRVAIGTWSKDFVMLKLAGYLRVTGLSQTSRSTFRI